MKWILFIAAFSIAIFITAYIYKIKVDNKRVPPGS